MARIHSTSTMTLTIASISIGPWVPDVVLQPSEDVFDMLKNTLVEQFELDPAKITPEARLSEDLDLDSIDAVDMVIKLQELTGRKVSPEDFKSVRTVGDVQRVIEKLLSSAT